MGPCKFAEALDKYSLAPQMVDDLLFAASRRKPQHKVEARMLPGHPQFTAEGLAQLSEQQIPPPPILISRCT